MELVSWFPGYSLTVKSQNPREYGYRSQNLIDGELQTTVVKIEDGGWCFYDPDTDEDVGLYEFATRVVSSEQ